MRTVELFYDIVSPYSYLALVALERYREAWSIDLVLRPAFLGGVMQAVGNVPPASLPARAPYLLRDIARKSRFFDVPMSLPDEFPGKTLSAMRLLVLVAKEAPERHSAMAHALFAHHWGEGKALTDLDVLKTLATSVGVDAAIVDRLGEPATKELLKAVTDEVIERGAFGFPAIFTDVDGDDTMFFGSDRLDVLAFELGLPWHGPRGPAPQN